MSELFKVDHLDLKSSIMTPSGWVFDYAILRSLNRQLYFIAGVTNIISSMLYNKVVVDGSELSVEPFMMNGCPVWTGRGKAIFYSLLHGWILHTSLDEPDFYTVPGLYEGDRAEKRGDTWWALSDAPIGNEETEISLTQQGNFSEPGTSPVITLKWPRWQSSQEYGEYTAIGQAAAPIYYGHPTWRSLGKNFCTYIDDNGDLQVDGFTRIDAPGRNTKFRRNGHDIFTYIEGSEPIPGSDWQLTGYTDEGSEEITMYWRGYTERKEKRTAYFAEVAQWA